MLKPRSKVLAAEESKYGVVYGELNWGIGGYALGTDEGDGSSSSDRGV